jgi:hypothetical protein
VAALAAAEHCGSGSKSGSARRAAVIVNIFLVIEFDLSQFVEHIKKTIEFDMQVHVPVSLN